MNEVTDQEIQELWSGRASADLKSKMKAALADPSGDLKGRLREMENAVRWIPNFKVESIEDETNQVSKNVVRNLNSVGPWVLATAALVLALFSISGSFDSIKQETTPAPTASYKSSGENIILENATESTSDLTAQSPSEPSQKIPTDMGRILNSTPASNGVRVIPQDSFYAPIKDQMPEAVRPK